MRAHRIIGKAGEQDNQALERKGQRPGGPGDLIAGMSGCLCRTVCRRWLNFPIFPTVALLSRIQQANQGWLQGCVPVFRRPLFSLMPCCCQLETLKNCWTSVLIFFFFHCKLCPGASLAHVPLPFPQDLPKGKQRRASWIGVGKWQI